MTDMGMWRGGEAEKKSNAPHLRIFASPYLQWLRRNFALIVTLAAVVSAVATYAVITGGNAPLGIKPRRVLNFLILDIALLLLLLVIVAARVYALWVALRAGSAGSQLQKRILVLFGIVSITPTLIVSVFSVFFFNLGIQTWFNERVQTAVEASLAVAEAYLAEHKENIRGDALAMAGDLSQVGSLVLTDPMEYNRIVATQSALRLLTEAIVFRGNRIIAQGRLSFALALEHIPEDVIERAAKGEVVIMTAEDDKVQALLQLEAPADAYLLVGRLIDSKVLAHMQRTQGAVHEYRTLRQQLDRLQLTFSALFVTLSLLLLLASVWYGMVFASRLTRPISGLAVAAERVRGGDFSVRVADTGEKDEIASLSRAFNRMTEQLEAQRGELIEANRRIDERRRFSEAVLAGVSAGVIALDLDKRITLSSRSAGAILGKIDTHVAPDMRIAELLPGIQESLAQAEEAPGEVVESTLTLNKNAKTLSLHVRVTAERFGSVIEGFIVTFDDITLLVAAQRGAAWADVARRVAHEIKNPLTPIQLAAERLRRKYLRFISEDRETFVRYIDTITRHVADIGKMVEEFVAFARMPAPKFSSEEVGSIVKKSVFSAQIANPAIEYLLELPPQEIFLHCDERQMTQVMTNLLKNAAESIETRLSKDEQQEKGRIRISLSRRNEEVTLAVEDNGTGFPSGEMQKMLEPYVTTRSRGTGLGLAIVKKIIDDHKGRISIENITPQGARVTLYFLHQCDI